MDARGTGGRKRSRITRVRERVDHIRLTRRDSTHPDSSPVPARTEKGCPAMTELEAVGTAHPLEATPAVAVQEGGLAASSVESVVTASQMGETIASQLEATGQASQIVASATVVEQTGATLLGDIPIELVEEWAPAWFYSALNWLGKSYQDANNSQQHFSPYMIGSDVDPYQQLGSTRLFIIERMDDEAFQMSVAADVSSTAPASKMVRYPATDAGVLAMYKALSGQAVFAAAKYCYIPGRYATTEYSEVGPAVIRSGYDPATGIRVIVEGSAVVQVVPTTDFVAKHNEQVYDDQPQIVPIVTALVYDITQNNEVGATTFSLPIYYTAT